MTNVHSSEIEKGRLLGNPRVRRWRDADPPAGQRSRVSSDDSSDAIVFWDEV